jgi:hypothetical protein
VEGDGKETTAELAEKRTHESGDHGGMDRSVKMIEIMLNRLPDLGLSP